MKDFTGTYTEYFKGKKITMMGLGVLGRGVGDAAYLAHAGAELIITDLKDADALKTQLTSSKILRILSLCLVSIGSRILRIEI